MADDHDNGNGADADDLDEEPMPEEIADFLDLELDTQSRIFLEMRRQNIQLLRIAAQVAGLSGERGPIKPNDLRQSLKTLWEVYADFYTWVDPEESDEDDEEDEE